MRSMSPTEYLKSLETTFQSGRATEHSYRAAFAALVESRAKEEVRALNDPKREKCGAPDYAVFRKRDRLTIGWIETKDFGLRMSLDEVEKSDQLTRYFAHLPNLVLTDYLEIRWYVRREHGIKREGDGHFGRLVGSKIISDHAEQESAMKALDGFLRHKPALLTSARDLAVRLADFTQMIRGIIVEAFAKGEASDSLRDWRAAFARTLLPELAANPDPKKERDAVSEFADMFAQTLSYGLFSARAAGPGGSFTRENARKLVPRTNPFLRDFFEQITGSKLDDEAFAGFVEDIIQTLGHADIDAVLRDFGTRNRRSDPGVHFYETFLHAYDPKLRELRGVYYTPEPVVNYIVESLDKLLKEEFDIKDGLADRSKITVTRKEGEKSVRQDSHRVLILDPATGTATFLYRVLDFIRQQFETKKRAGAWGDYVHEHLLPRLFGFELLMAPYAVAHFKLGLALAARDEPELWRQQWSYEPRKDERINVFLTNTLEDLESATEQLGPLRILSNEANSAYEIKKHKPVLVILGNPPYANFGRQNRGKWILGLLDDYKRGLKEKKLNINDDFIKFIRWAQWRIEQTGSGVIGMITNNVYLDGLTHRRMRECLLETFDEIYLVNLHGSAKKQETAPDGSKDDNVFDITIGVAIVLLVRLPTEPNRKKEHATVRHADLWGKRASKYTWLDSHNISNTKWTKLTPVAPGFYFVPKDFAGEAEYKTWWSALDMFPISSSGIQTKRDKTAIAWSRKDLELTLRNFAALDPITLARKYELPPDGRDWRIEWATEHAKVLHESGQGIAKILYRPFDIRWTVSDDKSKGFVAYPRYEVMRHMQKENIGMILFRQLSGQNFRHVFSTKYLIDGNAVSLQTKEYNYLFPLYLYPNGKLPGDDLFVREELEEKRRPNFSAAFIKEVCDRLKVKFDPDGLGKPSEREVGPELIFNYAYAIFHSPTYRQRYTEFLRTDFPRLPITRNYDLFQKLAGFGGYLVDLHAHGEGNGSGISFPVKGSNMIEEVRYQPPQTHGNDRHSGRVWINKRQYFEGISPQAWSFPIGGYQPAERWLKDRKGRTLSYEDKETYPRIIAALAETRRLMSEIEKTIHKHGGWPKAFQ
jgi:hypothetical protein